MDWDDAMSGQPIQTAVQAAPSSQVPKLLLNFMRRIMGLPPGRAYALTLWIPEDEDSEPVWTLKDLGKIENQR